MSVKCDLLIRGGTVIDPSANVFGIADVLIREGKIVAAAAGDQVEAEKEIDASECLIMPGLAPRPRRVLDIHPGCLSSEWVLALFRQCRRQIPCAGYPHRVVEPLEIFRGNTR